LQLEENEYRKIASKTSGKRPEIIGKKWPTSKLLTKVEAELETKATRKGRKSERRFFAT